MKEKIKKLKELRFIHKIASEYDYVPSDNDDNYIEWEDFDRSLLAKYQGDSPYDIEQEILRTIDGLE